MIAFESNVSFEDSERSWLTSTTQLKTLCKEFNAPEILKFYDEHLCIYFVIRKTHTKFYPNRVNRTAINRT